MRSLHTKLLAILLGVLAVSGNAIAADTTIDFGSGNTTRYYTIPAFTFADADWAIGFWERFSATPDANRRVVITTDSIGEGGAINIETAHYDETGYETIAGIWDNNGNGTFFGTIGQAGSYAPGQDTLVVVQRRGSNVEFYRVPTGVTASAPFSTEAHSFNAGHNGNSNPTYYIGRRPDGSRSRIEPFGEFFVISGSSLTTAEVNTLAAGAHITAVASPLIDLRFRTSNATEPNLGSSGSSNDATQFGTGWALVDEFFPDGVSGSVVPIILQQH